ncbi:hypothetical protein PUMCH_002446 [Australozyma saopauloensis]|uniref:Ubiquitin-activating enzyme E1-like n=1 Tax=Australozyma saopauloensis TaxID=291208 RepID=A0AAX4H9G6_9ASCO|nr:hypothetical protein PUMCH_002446 [[Candida] saopauloensis]
MGKDTYLRKILGPERLSKIRASKVLMVGAGGIGCELLKDLLLSGFGEIHIIDLDTITLSNLNRQFLFLKEDIDKLKSLIVAKNVQSFNYFDCKLIPYHGNVMDTKAFPLEWYNQFDYIYNALDNLEARRYVNKIALFLRKPLMESGTTGFDGQVQPIYPYETECFDCLEKATPQTFPVCTIRSTPSKPVHCIVWAKEFLFQQLFSFSTLQEVLQDQLRGETDDSEEIDRINKEANELFALKSLISQEDFPSQVIRKIYDEDIEKSLRLETLWKNREKPQVLDFENTYKGPLMDMLSDASNESILSDDARSCTLLEILYIFWVSIVRLQKRVNENQELDILFDKDDEDTLNFVSAAANLRSHAFHIDLQTKFDIKQIAGNIIPAIATTNAIISGFSDLASLNYWNSNFETKHAKTTFISIKENKRATSAAVGPPSKKCASCGQVSRGIANISKDMLKMTVQDLLLKIIKKYGYGDDISLLLGQGELIYDYDFDDNLESKLADIKSFKSNEILLIQDEEDNWENLELYLNFVDGDSIFDLPDLTLRPKPQVELPKEDEDKNDDNGPELEAGFIEIDDEDEPPAKKRKIQEEIEIL